MDVKAYADLSRPLNILVASIAIFISAFMTKEMNYKVTYAILSVALITAGGNAINDYFDFQIDRINKPKRPLPSGRASPRGAYIFSIVTFCMGCIAALFINLPCFVIAVSASLLLYFYAKTLKNSGFPGNLTIAALTGMAIVYAGISVSSIENVFYIATFAFLINLGREIIKDVEDYEGDNALGARTLPIKYGMKRAISIATIPLLVMFLVTPIPYLTGLYNIYYMTIIIIGIDIPMLYLISKLLAEPTVRNAERTKSILKVMIIIGIVGLYLGL
ncbi:MAG: geranylgeranylglycerol-phosphate geranylgeranyltransferase [Candidatus Methanofastidiosa archaeon]|nr:geranylgeranylglycerol-phosphate geranylgeranyltransferase [Candidatus Methanofastidiosa archaeon]